jgi:hypothetical protein
MLQFVAVFLLNTIHEFAPNYCAPNSNMKVMHNKIINCIRIFGTHLYVILALCLSIQRKPCLIRTKHGFPSYCHVITPATLLVSKSRGRSRCMTKCIRVHIWKFVALWTEDFDIFYFLPAQNLFFQWLLSSAYCRFTWFSWRRIFYTHFGDVSSKAHILYNCSRNIFATEKYSNTPCPLLHDTKSIRQWPHFSTDMTTQSSTDWLCIIMSYFSAIS